jgi:hypothetical protein
MNSIFVEIQIKGKAIVIGAGQAKSVCGYALPRAAARANAKASASLYCTIYNCACRKHQSLI